MTVPTDQKTVEIHLLNGLSDYGSTKTYQESLQQKLITEKLSGKRTIDGFLLFCQHPHVYTLGKFGNKSNLLADILKLRSISAEFYQTDRGGDITYHGPGQLVGYPVFNLDAFTTGIKNYVFTIEQAIINVMEMYNIHCQRLEGATGVWIKDDHAHSFRKICAIGIRVNRGVSMHGFALNVNTDLSYFGHINPCGFTDKSVTSMQQETGRAIEMNEVIREVTKQFEQLFQFNTIAVNEITIQASDTLHS